MGKRAVLAGLLAAVGMFVWSSIAHMLTPLGDAGIHDVPNEDAVLTALRAAGADSGMYLYPGLGLGSNSTRAERSASMDRYAAKLATSPSGMIVYHPPGAKPITPQQLITEFLTELAEALIAVFLLVRLRAQTFGSRVGFLTLIGVIGATATNIPYWNWYGFPTIYTVSYMTIQIVSFCVAGLIVATVLRNQPANRGVATA